MRRTLEWSRDGWTISTDARRVQLDVVHGYLARSYWAERIPRELVARSIENSVCFGVYERGNPERQVGFARVITDFATFAWIADVFVLEEARGRGLATWLMEVIAAHTDLQGLRRWNLVTRDAHGLYRKTGFVAPAAPESYMERRVPDAYRKSSAQPPA
jgi:GNAT superfamily N-acetyltransferase